MNHFSIAFGTITAVVIGGALVLDHVTSHPGKVAVVAPSTPGKTRADASSRADATLERNDATKLALAESPAAESPADRSVPKVSAPQATSAPVEKTAPRKLASTRKPAPPVQDAAPAPSGGDTISDSTSPALDAPSPSTTVPADTGSAPASAEPDTSK